MPFRGLLLNLFSKKCYDSHLFMFFLALTSSLRLTELGLVLQCYNVIIRALRLSVSSDRPGPASCLLLSLFSWIFSFNEYQQLKY